MRSVRYSQPYPMISCLCILRYGNNGRIRKGVLLTLPSSSRIDMNTEPFEHALPAVTLIEQFYGNLLKYVGGVRSLLPQSRDGCACPNAPFFLSDCHERYPVFDADLKRLYRNEIQIYDYHVYRCSRVGHRNAVLLGWTLSGGSSLGKR